MTLADRLRDDVAELEPDVVKLRHRLHRRPEIGLELPETQQAVLDALAGLPLEISTGSSCSSVTAVLRGAGAAGAGESRGETGGAAARGYGRAAGARGHRPDFASPIDGAMHACGHDLHIAMLCGAARLLSGHRDALAGDVVFMFQPGEEGRDGARQ